MFSSKGLFKDITCPKLDDCTLPACIFSHPEPGKTRQNDAEAQEYDPFALGTSPPPPTKKRKLDHNSALTSRLTDRISSPRGSLVEGTSETARIVSSEVAIPFKDHRSKGKAESSNVPANVSQPKPPSTTPASPQRPVSPPPRKVKPNAASTADSPKTKPPESLKVESLVPRAVPQAPDLLKKRLVILQGLHQQLNIQNKRIIAGDSKWKSVILTDQELAKFALDKEEEAARKYESEIYRNHMTQQIFKIKKMSEEEWRAFVGHGVRKQPERTSKAVSMPPFKRSSGLATAEQEHAVLRSIRTSLAGLEEYGYVTKQPTAVEIASARAGAEASAGWEKCDRCDTRFQVFAGRDSDGRLTTGGPCLYHWAKWNRPPPQKTDRVNGRAAPTYACCNKEIGSEGCTEAESHVFKVSDKKRLASIWQFEHTPANAMTKKTPVSFDCEMGYTTLGLEVIRVTAVSWPEGSELLDVLVRPYGEVLDLNTRFSGVSKKQFMEAVTYDEILHRRGGVTVNEVEVKALSKVESPAAVRQLLFDLLTPETPLIGHAIDNDLNVVRIIHPLVIDTVLLYPHPKGLPIRFGLKMLASKHLDRHIQASDAAGHDSKEDAIATGDLVTVAVAEKWKRMERGSWTFDGDLLVPPQAAKKAPATAKAKAAI
jgi:hypothetical protein